MRIYNKDTKKEYFSELGGLTFGKFIKALKDDNNTVSCIETDVSKTSKRVLSTRSKVTYKCCTFKDMLVRNGTFINCTFINCTFDYDYKFGKQQLIDCTFTKCINIPLEFSPNVGYKIISVAYLVKAHFDDDTIKIPLHVGFKTNKAIIDEIIPLVPSSDSIINFRYKPYVTYTKGETVYPSEFRSSRQIGNGLHFHPSIRELFEDYNPFDVDEEKIKIMKEIIDKHALKEDETNN